MSRIRIATLLVLAAGILAAAVVAPRLRPPTFHGTDVGPDSPRREFTLRAEHGPVSLSDFQDRVTVVFFGYTSCPDVCPPTMARLARTLELLGDPAEDVQVLLVTVDPTMDTPARLGEYVRAFDPGFVGLHGDEATLRQVARDFGAWGGEPVAAGGSDAAGHQRTSHHEDHAGPPNPDGDPGDQAESASGAAARIIAHSAYIFGVDRAGRLRVVWNGDHTAEELAEDLRALLRI